MFWELCTHSGSYVCAVEAKYTLWAAAEKVRYGVFHQPQDGKHERVPH